MTAQSRLGPNGGDAVSPRYAESFDLAEKLIDTRKKHWARKAEQKKKKPPGKGWVRFLQKDAWWLVDQSMAVWTWNGTIRSRSSSTTSWLSLRPGRASSNEGDYLQVDEVNRGVEEMGVVKGDADDGDIVLDEVLADKPG